MAAKKDCFITEIHEEKLNSVKQNQIEKYFFLRFEKPLSGGTYLYRSISYFERIIVSICE